MKRGRGVGSSFHNRYSFTRCITSVCLSVCRSLSDVARAEGRAAREVKKMYLSEAGGKASQARYRPGASLILPLESLSFAVSLDRCKTLEQDLRFDYFFCKQCQLSALPFALRPSGPNC